MKKVARISLMNLRKTKVRGLPTCAENAVVVEKQEKLE